LNEVGSETEMAVSEAAGAVPRPWELEIGLRPPGWSSLRGWKTASIVGVDRKSAYTRMLTLQKNSRSFRFFVQINAPRGSLSSSFQCSAQPFHVCFPALPLLPSPVPSLWPHAPPQHPSSRHSRCTLPSKARDHSIAAPVSYFSQLGHSGRAPLESVGSFPLNLSSHSRREGTAKAWRRVRAFRRSP
jgi:hypothetical protein